MIAGALLVGLGVSLTWNVVLARNWRRWGERALALENLRQDVGSEIQAAQVKRDTLRELATINVQKTG
jgi:hypothetical protein